MTVSYEGRAGLETQTAHVAQAGMVIPELDPEPEDFSVLQLCVQAAGASFEQAVRVVQRIPGTGVAVMFEDPAQGKAEFERVLAACPDGPAAASACWGRVETSADDDVERSEEDRATLHDRIRKMSVREKMSLALKGDRGTRLILMKDTNKSIHTFVIQNPKITVDEVRWMAGNRQTNPEVIQRIAANVEWLQNPRVVSALVCNPKSPSSVAVRLLDRLSMQEVRRIAKSGAAAPAVVQAAKRKVNG